jgi:phage tail protein X
MRIFKIEDVDHQREGLTDLEALMFWSMLWYYRDYEKRASEAHTHDDLVTLNAKASGVAKILHQCWRHANPGVYDYGPVSSAFGKLALPVPVAEPHIPEPNPPRAGLLARIFGMQT